MRLNRYGRYTNMTKIMFLAFWYSAIFPGGMLLAAVALAVNYYTDRFSLMRSWQRAPRVGTEISNISLNYFFSTALFFLAVMSSFYWSAFPFDNLCPTDQSVNPDFYGTYNVTTVTNTGNKTLYETVNSDTEVYRFCNQDFILRPGGPDFPFIYREGDPDFGSWMSEEQQFLSLLFGWTSIGFITLVLLKFMYGMYTRIRREFYAETEVCYQLCRIVCIVRYVFLQVCFMMAQSTDGFSPLPTGNWRRARDRLS